MKPTATVLLPPPMAVHYEWQLKARCKGYPVEVFYPGVPQGMGKWKVAAEMEAKQTCAVCSVIEDCLAHALNANEPGGIWGGHNYEERLAMRNR